MTLKFKYKIFLIYEFLNNLVFWGPLLIPFYTQYPHLNMAKILLLQSVYAYSTMFLEIPTGVIGDKYGRKISVILGDVFFAIGALIYSLFPAWYPLIIAEFLMGLGTAFASGATDALKYDTFKQHRKEKLYFKFLADTQKVMSAARLLSALIALGLAALNFVRWSFAAYGLMLFAASGLIALTIPEPQIETEELAPNYKQIVKSSLSVLQENKVLIKLLSAILLIVLIGYYQMWIGQKFLEFLKASAVWFAISRIVSSIASIAVNHWLPSIRKRVKDSGLFKLGAILGILSTLGMILFSTVSISHAAQLALVIIFMTLATRIYAATRLVLLNNIQKQIPSKVRATVLSFNGLLNSAIRGTLNPFMGMLADLNVKLVTYILFLSGAGAQLIAKRLSKSTKE